MRRLTLWTLLALAAIGWWSAPARAAEADLFCWQVQGGPMVAVGPSTPCPVTSIPSPATNVSKAQCAALCANLVAKATAGSLYSFEASADSTLSGAAWWLMIYDATAAPSDGAVTPAKCYAFPTGTTAFTGAFPTAIPFTAGITFGVSTTGCFTKTASTHAFIAVDYQ